MKSENTRIQSVPSVFNSGIVFLKVANNALSTKLKNKIKNNPWGIFINNSTTEMTFSWKKTFTTVKPATWLLILKVILEIVKASADVLTTTLLITANTTL